MMKKALLMGIAAPVLLVPQSPPLEIPKPAIIRAYGKEDIEQAAKLLAVTTPVGLFHRKGVPTSPPATNLHAWWMSTEAYTETTGTPTTKITVDATAIGSLKDMSGNGNHIYQTVGVNKPRYETSVFGALPSISTVTGGFGYLESGNPPTLNGSYSVYAVFKETTHVNNVPILGMNNATPRLWIINTTTSGQKSMGYGATTLTVSGFTVNNNHLLAATFQPSSNFYMARDDQAPANAASPANTGGGSSLMLLRNNSVGNTFVGELAEILIYATGHGDPSTGNGLIARQYLNAKYSLGFAI